MGKVSTNIKELDEALGGGIPQNHLVLVSGGAGVGKTTLSMQFLSNDDINFKSIFFTLNETHSKLCENFKEFSFFKEESVSNGNLLIVDMRTVFRLDKDANRSLSDPKAILNFIAHQLSDNKPSRIVIDSITAICNHFDDMNTIRHFLFELANLLSTYQCTSLLISETPPLVRQYSEYKVEEFMSDGIIYLSYLEKDNRLAKSLQVVKMRGTVHSSDRFMMNIQQQGITLLKMMDMPK